MLNNNNLYFKFDEIKIHKSYKRIIEYKSGQNNKL